MAEGRTLKSSKPQPPEKNQAPRPKLRERRGRAGGVEDEDLARYWSLEYWVSDGGGSPRRSAPVLGRSNVGTRASPNEIGRIGTTGARCARGRAHSDNVVVRRHSEAVKKLETAKFRRHKSLITNGDILCFGAFWQLFHSF